MRHKLVLIPRGRRTTGHCEERDEREKTGACWASESKTSREKVRGDRSTLGITHTEIGSGKIQGEVGET